MCYWTSCHPANIAGSPVIHLCIEIVGPLGALAIAQKQDPSGEFGHLLEVADIHHIRVSPHGSIRTKVAP
jgi:hypothetical protein